LQDAELSKSRTLFETSSVRSAARNSLLSEAESEKLSDLEFRIARLNGQIPLTADVAGRADLESQRNGLATTLLQENERLQRLYPRYRDATEPHVATAAELAKLLPENAAFLNLVHSGPRIVLLWATARGDRGIQILPTVPNLAETIDVFREALSKPEGLDALRYPNDGAPARLVWKMRDGSFRVQERELGVVNDATVVRQLDDIRDSLSSWLVGTLPQRLLESRRWFISPDGPLSLMPFETLALNGRLLVEDHDISVAQSISMTRLSRDRIRSYAKLDRRPILVVGDPTYLRETQVDQPRGINLVRGALRGPAGRSVWPNLPGSAKELSLLGKLFPLREGSNLFRKSEASRVNVLALQTRGELARFKYVVFSTHGYLDRRNSDLSGIVLSQVGLKDEDDGYLRASDLAAFSFRSDLVFISACEAGVGTFVSGEGVLGLPFALFAAGNANTVLTLWQIFDGSTAEFTDRFFAKIKAGMSMASALSETKREFIRGDAGEERRSPAYWAPFVLYGGPQ
jgi:CHAT domain-containing protein